MEEVDKALVDESHRASGKDTEERKDPNQIELDDNRVYFIRVDNLTTLNEWMRNLEMAMSYTRQLYMPKPGTVSGSSVSAPVVGLGADGGISDRHMSSGGKHVPQPYISAYHTEEVSR